MKRIWLNTIVIDGSAIYATRSLAHEAPGGPSTTLWIIEATERTRAAFVALSAARGLSPPFPPGGPNRAVMTRSDDGVRLIHIGDQAQVPGWNAVAELIGSLKEKDRRDRKGAVFPNERLRAELGFGDD